MPPRFSRMNYRLRFKWARRPRPMTVAEVRGAKTLFLAFRGPGLIAHDLPIAGRFASAPASEITPPAPENTKK